MKVEPVTFKSTVFKIEIAIFVSAFAFCAGHALAWQSDNGDGTFSNPVLYADYPDPDIIRVTNDFYMVSTTFVDSPGINVLHSKDLVNWELISHCATNLDGGNAYNMIGGTAYQSGFWASSIRYYNGTFYVVANPTFANSRIYYATNAAGPWQYYQLNQVSYDPGLFIDSNGAGYIIAGHGPQSVFVLNSTFSQIVSVSNNVVNSGGEGSHVVKRGSYYYLFNANPGTWPYQLRCSRATNIFGPWETGHICLTATTGGHQGSIVDINDSDQWFGFVHQDSGSIGRMPRIGPVFWENNWPVFGTTTARDQMAASYTKPIAGQPILQPATSDEFANSTLGLQWQWNHNPDNTRWSLTERPGYLRLRPTLATNFWVARNTLTQKGQGPLSQGIVKLDLSNLQSGDVAGFGTLGKVSAHIAVSVGAGGVKKLTTRMIKDQVGSYAWEPGVTIAGNTLYLRTDLNFTNNLGSCSYSTNGATWTSLGGNFELMWGYGSTFQGEKFAIFCYNTNTPSSAGYVDVDSFTFGDTAPQVTIQRGRPQLNAARTTFVADNGQPLRGPYTSTEWTSATSSQNIANMKNLGFNAVHLYAESFDRNYPTNGSTAPGYHLAEVDKIVAETRTNGLYLVMTIGNGAWNGQYNLQWITNFWGLYSARYANETHVLFEIQNEPVAWGPPYSSPTATPPGALDMEVATYNIIRANAPNTPVLLFSYAVLGGTGGADAALTDIHAFNQAVFGNQNAVWTNAAVGFHGYAGAGAFEIAVSNILRAGYPCFQTEFGAGTWGGGPGGLDVDGVAALERLGVSWLAFAYIPPTGVSDDVTKPEVYTDRVNNSGLSWTPDYGTWPVARSVHGNNGNPWPTPDYNNNTLTGTLRIEAENFDNGGKGVAYYNGNSSNPGGQYRTSETVGIGITSDTGGGYNVGWTAAGDWLEYAIRVPQAGTYNLRLRVAGTTAGSVQVLAYGADLTGEWTLPGTGGAQTWQTVAKSVFLNPGRQKLRINVLAGGFNLNWIELSPATSGPIADGTYKILNAASGVALDLDSNNVVITDNYSGSSSQQWNFQHIGGGQYKVSSVAKGNSWYAWGGPLHLLPWGWGAGGDTCYIFRPTGGGYYRFFTAGGGTSFEPSSSNPPELDDAIYTGAAKQQWAIVSPSAPAFPTGLSAELAGPAQAYLNWNAVVGATSYNVKRSTNSGGTYTTIATGVTTTNYTDNGISAGVACYYVVSAVAGGVEGINSSEAALQFPKLTGAIIGTAGSWNNSGNTITNVFDGNLNTYFDGPVANGCWAGLDFGAGAGNVITRINYCPRSGFADRMPGGVFQGANQANFSDAVTLFTITTLPSSGTFTSVDVTDTSTFRYVRYLSPNNGWGNVAELEFYGYHWSMPTPSPTGLIAQAPSDTQVNLTWNAFTGATGYNVKRSPVSGGPYATIATGVTTNNYTDTVAAGMKWYYVVSAITGGVETTNSSEAAVNLPFPWMTQDVGVVGLPGSASYSSGVFTTVGAGADIQGAADAFRFVYVPVTGNCVIVARVVSVQNVDAWSKAGVMIRESLNDNAANAFVGVTPGNGVTWQNRSSTGGSTAWNNTTALSAPHWVRLVRSGSTFTGYRSTDGTNWTVQGTATFTMASTVYVGLAITSHNNSSLCTATFDKVTAPGWSSPMPPVAPSGLIAAAWDARAGLNWTGSGGATSYNVKRASTNGGPYTIVANVTGTNCADTGLVNGAMYYYVVSALNPAGESANSVQASVIPQSFTPTGLAATAASSSQINLVWNGSTNATGYNVKRSLTNGGSYTTIASGVTATNYSDGGLAGGTIYYYVVSAVSGGSETADSAQAAATTHSPTVGSLVHRYSFSEAGGTSVADSVGGPVWAGTLPNGGTLSSGQLMLSPGSQQYASLPSGIVGSLSNFTVMAWVNLASVSDWCRVFDFWNDLTTHMFLTPQCGGSGTVRFEIMNGGSAQQINCNATMSTGVWHQVAVTLTRTNGVLYLDGVAVGTNSAMTINPSSLGNTANNYIGRSEYANPYLDGALEEFRIYNAGLSSAEVAASFALGSGQLLSTNSPVLSLALTETNLTLSWPLANAGFTLQSRTNLMLGEWEDVPAPEPQIVGGQWQVTLPSSGDVPSVFYRISRSAND